MDRAFTVAVEGAAIHGGRRGAAHGPPLALLHGFGGSRASWDMLLAHLPADLPVLRHDLRDFGASAGDGTTPFDHAQDLLAVLDAQQIERASLCGLSLGGGVAIRFALDHPERTQRLILVSPALSGWDWSDDWRLRFRACVKAARSGDLPLARQLWWRHPLFDPVRESEGAGALRREIEDFAGLPWLRNPELPVAPDLDRLGDIAVPCLLLSGARDLPDFRLMADALEALVPGIERIDYPAAGHMLPFEAPREIAGAIGRFLAH